MKHWKQGFIGLLGIFALLLAFIACDDGKNNDPKCECTNKVHPYGSPCTCPVAGTSACDCTEADPFEGTWIGTQSNPEMTIKLVAANGSFTQYNGNVLKWKGTYSVSENTVTMIWTHEYKDDEWGEENPITLTGTILDNTLTTDVGITFTKQ